MSDEPMHPGEVLYEAGTIVVHAESATSELAVVNTGDRPVQIGSHFHFAEVNPALSFDRDAALGMHLAIPAGTSVRFEPGAGKRVRLTRFAGARYVAGFTGAVGGLLDE